MDFDSILLLCLFGVIAVCSLVVVARGGQVNIGGRSNHPSTSSTWSSDDDTPPLPPITDESDHRHFEFARVNPATNLPMIGDSMVDVGGHTYGNGDAR